MHAISRVILLAVLLAAVLAGALRAADPGVGSTRADVIARYGPPRAILSGGSREILTYPSGRVVLEGGVVTKFELPALPARGEIVVAPAAQAQAKPATPPPAAAPARQADPDPWLTDFAEAKAQALASRRRILALFTGSDWCPACMEFEGQVSHNPDFLATTRASFVLLKLDYPQSKAQPQALRAQNSELRSRFGIAAYPTLLILGPDGDKQRKVDNTSPRKADGIVDFYVQAVDDARRAKGEEPKWWWPF